MTDHEENKLRKEAGIVSFLFVLGISASIFPVFYTIWEWNDHGTMFHRIVPVAAAVASCIGITVCVSGWKQLKNTQTP